jgi:UDP-N-acetylglucosamine--N-acetylmuramyl-(pentapeptide) pyrophosphoryl-undecaprenol N-acetylglucosamine transferase
MSSVEKRIVLAAGGTGGHVFPAQALADELASQGYKVFLLTDGRGYHFQVLSISMISIPAGHLHGSLGGKIRGSVKLLAGFGAALYHLRRIKPQGVVGFGGYASFPTMMAAATLRLPTLIHQADAYFGRANRGLAPFMTHLATSFPHVENIPLSCQKKVSFVGLPVRKEIQPSPYEPSLEKAPFHILVTGGSQGAKIFGEIIPRAVQLLTPELQQRLHIVQQCRAESLDTTRMLYAQTLAHVELAPFLHNMGDHYRKAHLVISRAGASSVVETALSGRPALFIPYPYAMDNHQFYNAQQAVKAKGGWLIQEKELTSEGLASFLSEVMSSHWKLMQTAANIRTIVIPDAAARLANLVKVIVSEER